MRARSFDTERRDSPAPLDRLSRRELLRLAALGLGAVALGGVLGGCKSQSRPATALPPPTGAASPTPTPSSTLSPYPDVVVARTGEPEPLVRAAIGALGGMGRFVPKRATVVVKPNICVAGRGYQYAATTNPWVVGTLVKLALEAGAGEVKVLDYGFGGPSAQAYVTSGIGEQVEAAGGRMVVISDRDFVPVQIPNGKWLRQTEVYRDVLEADVLINVPVAKTHLHTLLTLGMKNLMGVVRDRQALHVNLEQAIADLNTAIRPALNVIDCIRVMANGGPTGGNLSDVRKLDTIVASTDVVAADCCAASLFGIEPYQLSFVGFGAELGLGEMDLSKLRIEEVGA
jgi:uncharacterized protein (DUF362 family)